MPSEQTSDETWLPYLSFTTFTNFLDRLGDGPIPPRIDKSALDTYSGGTQGVLMLTLRGMGLTDAEGNVTGALREAATDLDARKALLRAYVLRTYPEQQALAEKNGTAQMLHESFGASTYKGSTLRKAIVFYLALVEYTGLPTSPHFRPPRQTQANPRKKRANAPAPEPEKPEAPPTTSGQGESLVVTLGDAGSVTLSVDVRWLALPQETFLALRKLTDDLRSLESLSAGDADLISPDPE